MSKPRPVYPGAVLFVTRRVHKRQLLLRPEPRLNQLLEYIVAVLAERHGILLHALCAMSNHTHWVASDPLGNIVEFERDVHALIARALNAMHGEFEALWAREPSSRVTCLGSASVLDKIAYTMANPVDAGLVAHGKSWPGVRRAWPARPRVVNRPVGFFRDADEGGAWPEAAILAFHRPPRQDDLTDSELAAHLEGLIEDRERSVREAAKAAGKSFLGRRAVLDQDRHAYPKTSEHRFTLRPTVAGRSRWAILEKLQADRDWLEAYYLALHRLCAGDLRARFPPGTWKLWTYYRIPREDPPDPLGRSATAF